MCPYRLRLFVLNLPEKSAGEAQKTPAMEPAGALPYDFPSGGVCVVPGAFLSQILGIFVGCQGDR
jgi:hypothetical protein